MVTLTKAIEIFRSEYGKQYHLLTVSQNTKCFAFRGIAKRWNGDIENIPCGGDWTFVVNRLTGSYSEIENFDENVQPIDSETLLKSGVTLDEIKFSEKLFKDYAEYSQNAASGIEV